MRTPLINLGIVLTFILAGAARAEEPPMYRPGENTTAGSFCTAEVVLDDIMNMHRRAFAHRDADDEESAQRVYIEFVANTPGCYDVQFTRQQRLPVRLVRRVGSIVRPDCEELVYWEFYTEYLTSGRGGYTWVQERGNTCGA